jgi:hypothetical protein
MGNFSSPFLVVIGSILIGLEMVCEVYPRHPITSTVPSVREREIMVVQLVEVAPRSIDHGEWTYFT